MPSQVRIISGPRNTAYDRFVAELIEQDGLGAARDYFGITSQERADEVRRRMKQAGRHLGVAVKAYWYACTGCQNGGSDCRFHVSFTAYAPDAARRYKAQQQRQPPPARGR